MNFLTRIKNLESILEEAYNAKFIAEEISKKLTPYMKEDNDDISPIITEMCYLHNTTEEMRSYLLKLFPYISKTEHLSNVSKLGGSTRFFSNFTKKEFTKTFAEYPTWLNKKEEPNKILKSTIPKKPFSEYFDLRTKDNSDTDGILEGVGDIAERMVCEDSVKFQHLGPRNGLLRCKEGCYMLTCDCIDTNWYNEECDGCGLSIRNKSHVIRLPGQEGGWIGCYCGFPCMLDNKPQDDDYDYTKDLAIELMFTQLEEYGILDKYKEIKTKKVNTEKSFNDDILEDVVIIPLVKK